MFARVSLAMLCWFAVTAPAHGQSGVWQFDNADALRALEASCVAGEFTTSESQIDRIRNSAQATMAEYFERAHASEVADVSNLFSRRHRVWRRIADDASKDFTDPVARAGAAPLQEPEVFLRAGDRETSAGLWVVRAADDPTRVVGYYRAAFRWEFGRWKLESLELGEPDNALTLTPYCHGIGDVDAHGAEGAQTPNAARTGE